MRYVKNGVVRETDSVGASERLLACGYEALLNDEEVRDTLEETLADLTVEQLRELCRQRGLTPPEKTKKAELVETIVSFDTAEPGGASADD